MDQKPVVSILRCEDYDVERVEAAVRRAVDLLGGLGQYVRPGQRVLVKPNLLRPSPPEAAATTHPAVVRAVVRLVQEAGATPVIADAPGGGLTTALLKRVYRRTGMIDVAEETGADLSYDLRGVQVPNPNGALLKLIDVMAAVTEADAVINLPKLKTHNLTRLTGAVKNLFGVVPGVLKAAYHARLPKALDFSSGLVDIMLCVRPVLSIMDGIVAMDGNGPSGGDPFPGKVLLASADPVAEDVVAMSLAGWEPLSSPPLQVAAERGLTSGRLDGIELRGDPLEALLFAGFRPGTAAQVDPGLVPRWLRRFVMPLLAVRPADGAPATSGEIEAAAYDVGTLPRPLRRWAMGQMLVSPQAGSRCTGCGYCAKHCPVQAITVVDGRARMDLERCIRCYCCHELCPELAVELRRPWLGRLLFGR